MLYLFYGDDDYSVRRLGAATQERYADAGAFGVQRLDGAMAPWGQVVAACSVLPFLGSYQVVRVGGLIGASGRRRAEKSDDTAKPGISPDGLAALVSTLPESTVVILEEGPLQPTNPHLKKLSGLDAPMEMRECALLEGGARVRWVREEVQARGATIDAPSATELAARLPGPLWSLSGAIDTLICYAGSGGTITRAAVEELVAPAEDENVFHLTDAIVARQPGRALALLQTLMAGGMVEEQVLAMLVGRVRDWTLAAALKSEGLSEGEAIKRLGWSPGKYRMVTRATASFARGELPRAYQTLVIADEALKSRPADERPLILDLLLFTLATRADPEGLRQTFPIPIIG